MKSLGSRLKEAREKKRLTQLEAAKKVGISNGTLSGYERNYRDPDTETLKKLADLYEVSIDYLLGKSDSDGEERNQESEKPNPYALTPKEEKDVAKDVEKILNNLESDESLAFYGEPMDEETKELLRISLENSMRLAKEMAKKKFTPKKYRK